MQRGTCPTKSSSSSFASIERPLNVILTTPNLLQEIDVENPCRTVIDSFDVTPIYYHQLSVVRGRPQMTSRSKGDDFRVTKIFFDKCPLLQSFFSTDGSWKIFNGSCAKTFSTLTD